MEDQKARRSHKYKVPGLLLFVLVTLFLVELIRIIVLYRGVEEATSVGIRYAVTGEFNPDYCGGECERGSEGLRSAQLISIKDVMNSEFNKYIDNIFMKDIDQKKLRITICSDRDGVQFISDPIECHPQDDPGENGATVYVNATYPYSIGSILGLNFGPLSFDSARTGIAECHRLGCLSGIRIRLSGQIPDQFTIEISTDDGRYRLIECSDADVIRSKGFQSEIQRICWPDGASFYLTPPRSVNITVGSENGRIDDTLQPLYRISRPNGYRCPPTCLHSLIEIVVE